MTQAGKRSSTVKPAACAATSPWPTGKSPGTGRPRPGTARLTRPKCHPAMRPGGVGGARAAAPSCRRAAGGRRGT